MPGPAGAKPGVQTPDAAQLCLWYTSGLNVAQVAARAGAQRGAVSAALRTAGVPLRRGRQPARPSPDPHLAQELYLAQRYTLRQVAQELSCSAEQVKAVLVEHGMALRPSRRPAARPDPPALTTETLRELYVTRGLSLKDAGAVLGLGERQVAAALDEHGIARRPVGSQPAAPLAAGAEELRVLYVGRRLDDRAIGALYGVPAFRVRERRRALGVQRDRVPPPRTAPPSAPAAEVLHRLYVQLGLPIAVIARRYGTSTPTVRGWLAGAGVPIRPRTNRADRHDLEPGWLEERYSDREWSATEIAADADTSEHVARRALHQHGIAVRRGHGRSGARRLLDALYADQEILEVLREHQVPLCPDPGPIAERFPTPVRLTEALLRALYGQIGLSAHQVELLTGQPEEQVLDALHAAGHPVRHHTGRSPWTRRQDG